MGINMKYYRRLRRQNPQKAQEYLNKNNIGEAPTIGPVGRPRVREKPKKVVSSLIEKRDAEWLESVFPHEEYHIWSTTQEAYVVVKFRDPVGFDEHEVELAGIHEGQILDYPEKRGNLKTEYYHCPVKQGNFYIPLKYWYELSQAITVLERRKDVRGLWVLESTMMVPLSKFKRVDVDKALRVMLEPSESDFEADNL